MAEDNHDPKELALWQRANQEAREDIVRYKEHQWRAATVGVALFGGIIALANGMKCSTWAVMLGFCLARLPLAVAPWIIWLLGTTVVDDLHDAAGRARAKGAVALGKLGPLQEAEAPYNAEPNERMTRYFRYALSAGAVVTSLIVLAGG